MTMEYLIRFCISLFDLGVFWHYMFTFRKRKYVPKPACVCAHVLLYMIERISFHVKKQQEDELYIEDPGPVLQSAPAASPYPLPQPCGKSPVSCSPCHVSVYVHMHCAFLPQHNRFPYSASLGQTDEDSYSSNPSVDTVLRFKISAAKAEGIKVDTQIHIPKKLQIEYGDIGVLYGNLLDNAIEACRKVPGSERFISVENKYVSGRLLFVITNSKENWNNGYLKTTKKDTYNHGYGIVSVRRGVEKYNGVVQFKDNGITFEVSVMLYNIGVVVDEKCDVQ